MCHSCPTRVREQSHDPLEDLRLQAQRMGCCGSLLSALYRLFSHPGETETWRSFAWGWQWEPDSLLREAGEREESRSDTTFQQRSSYCEGRSPGHCHSNLPGGILGLALAMWTSGLHLTCDLINTTRASEKDLSARCGCRQPEGWTSAITGKEAQRAHVLHLWQAAQKWRKYSETPVLTKTANKD